MTDTQRDATISSWIAASNTHDSAQYLAHFTEDAVLDDPSVGERFEGHDRIADYFARYFIGYDTTTRLVSVTPQDDLLHVVVDFTGTFPGGQTGGIFDMRFTDGKISFLHADLA